MKTWYIDRDFAEVKESNSKIIASCATREQAEEIIAYHNQLIAEVVRLNNALNHLKSIIDTCLAYPVIKRLKHEDY